MRAKSSYLLLLAAACSTFDQLSETYGCPDCADGGAEWVEVERSRMGRRVTFEFGKPPERIGALVSSLRAVRQTLPPAE